MVSYCGVAEAASAGAGLNQWPVGHRLTWTVVRPLVEGFSADSLRDIYAAEWQKWDEMSGIRIEWTADVTRANILCGARRIQQQGVLAEAQLPWNGIRPDTQLRIWMNSQVRFIASNNLPDDTFDIRRVFLHEAGHSLGLGHDVDGQVDAIMDPTISHIRHLQPDDVEQIRLRYGEDKPPLDTDDDTGLIAAIGECLRALPTEDKQLIRTTIESFSQ